MNHMNFKKNTSRFTSYLCLLTFVFLMFYSSGCKKSGSSSPTQPDEIWDIDTQGIPKFVTTDYIELGKIYQISKFRSSVGHDYSDAFEHCRSMKHYFEPKGNVDWSKIKIFSPVTGKITRVDQEWAGTKLEIASDEHTAFRFSIFHINSPVLRNINDHVTAGEELGTHIGSQTMSDIAVMVNDPTHQGRMISYFEVIVDTLFSHYSARGVASRDSLIITKAQRDLKPLTCSGDTFVSADSLQSWVVLN